MSAFLDGIGAIVSKVTQWIPSKKESKQNEITRLLNENAKLAQQNPISASAANRIGTNADRIKQLRLEVDRIT